MLLLAQDEGSGMDDKQVRDEALTLLLAGHETTANALTWTWYLLSQNAEVERKFHAEIDALGGRLPTFDDLARLKYVEMVLAESMRLYPPAWSIGRRNLNEYATGQAKRRTSKKYIPVYHVELVRDRQTKHPLVPMGATGEANAPMAAFAKACVERGLVPLILGNRVHVAPPLNVSDSDVATGLAILDEALDVADEFT